MADPFRSKAKQTFYASGVGTTTGVTVTEAATAGVSKVITHFSASGDAAALVTLSWTYNGTAKTWKLRFTAAFQLVLVFPPGEFQADQNTAITLVISASTANCEAQFGGYTV